MSFELETSLDGDIAAVESLDRQLHFAGVTTATAVVKSAQRTVVRKIPETFTTRSPWYLPTNRYGIHYTPATVAKPTAALHTNAYWLVDHETGALRTPSDGDFLTIPTEAIQPDRSVAIPESQRPRNLPNAFIIETKRGPKLFDRINGQLRMIYNLVRRVRIEKKSTVVEPTVQVCEREFAPTYFEKLKEALKTAK